MNKFFTVSFNCENSMNSIRVYLHFPNSNPNYFYHVIINDDKYHIHNTKNVKNHFWYQDNYYKFFKYNIKLLQFDGEVVKLIHEENFDIKNHKFLIRLKSDNIEDIEIWKNYLSFVEKESSTKFEVSVNDTTNIVHDDRKNSIEISRKIYDDFLKISETPLTDDYSSLTIIKTLFDILDDKSLKKLDNKDVITEYQKKKFLIGPKLGDFFHVLYAVKCLSSNLKSDVYMAGNSEYWFNGIKNTYNDVYSVVKNQPYVDNFIVTDITSYDYNDGFVQVSSYTWGDFEKSWYDIYDIVYNIIEKFENEPWLYRVDYSDKYDFYEDKIIINFSNARYDDCFDPLIENIVKNNECIFIVALGDFRGYEKFKFKEFVEFKECESFSEFYSIIERCRFFIGNLSMPIVVAHGLFKPHLGFLYREDAPHYKDNFNKNYFWFDDKGITSDNFNKIHEFLKIDIDLSGENIIEKKKFLIGPKLGDFINHLYVVKCLSENTKSDVYITEHEDESDSKHLINEGFFGGLEGTHKDIYSIVKNQPYVDNFLIYDSNKKVEGIIDLRRTFIKYLDDYNLNFYESFKRSYKISNNFENEPWLYRVDYSDKYDFYEDKIVINFSNIRYDDVFDTLIENIVKSNECIFIVALGDFRGYEKFKFKEFVEFKECESFSEFYSIIERCKFFIGNQSMPLVVAQGLFKPHLGFLHRHDAIYFKNNFNENYFWIDNKKRTSENFNKIYSFIKIDMNITSIENNLNNIDFDISYNEDNRIYVFCDSNIKVSVVSFDLNDNGKILSWNYLDFNKINNFFYIGALKGQDELQSGDHIKVQIRDDDVILKEKILICDRKKTNDVLKIESKLEPENTILSNCDDCEKIKFDDFYDTRIPFYKLGEYYYLKGLWNKCIIYLEKCLAVIKYDPKFDIDFYYKDGPYSMLYVAYWQIGDKEKSKFCFDKALEFAPYNTSYLNESKYYYEYFGTNIIGSLSFQETQQLYSESKKFNSILVIDCDNNGRTAHALLNGCKGIVTAITKKIKNPTFINNVGNFGNIKILDLSSKDAEEELKNENFDMIFIDGENNVDVKNDILLWEKHAKKLLCGSCYTKNKKNIDKCFDVIVKNDIWYKNIPTQSKKKKIALCISGYLRTFKECYPSILENVIQDNDVDIFIHTYDKLGHSKGWRDPIDLSEDIDLSFLDNIPKKIVTEKWDDIKWQFEKFKKIQPNCTNIDVIATIFYKIYKCNELKKQYEKENGFIYDLVIRMRGDQIFTKKINLDFPDNKILINEYPWGDEDFVDQYQQKDSNGVIDSTNERESLNDRFAAGNSANIDYLSDLYNRFEELITNSPRVELEYLLYKYLQPIELEKRKLFFYVKRYIPRLIKPKYF